jgi:hypothetical protein
VFPSGEDFVLFSILTLQYKQFSTKFLIQIRRNSFSSYAVFIPNYVQNAISHLPDETLIVELTTESFQKLRMTDYKGLAPKQKQTKQSTNYLYNYPHSSYMPVTINNLHMVNSLHTHGLLLQSRVIYNTTAEQSMDHKIQNTNIR